MSMTVYGFARSRAQRAVWALEEAGLDYDYREMQSSTGEHRRPEFLALNPGGKVPTLVHDDFVVTESAVICTYVGEQAGTGLVPPAGTRARTDYERWMAFVISELEQPLWAAAQHTFVLPEKLRIPAVRELAPKLFARAEHVLSVGLGDRAFIAGDSFTMADVMVAHTLFWAMSVEVRLQAENVLAYCKRMGARPAWLRTMQLTMGGS